VRGPLKKKLGAGLPAPGLSIGAVHRVLLAAVMNVLMSHGSAVATSGPAVATSGPGRPAMRHDILNPLHQIICREGKVPGVRELWAAGIFDAQLDGHVLRRREREAITDREAINDLEGREGREGREGNMGRVGRDEATAFARSRAAGLYHAGIGSGTCEDGRSFAVSVPAPAPMVVSKDKVCVPREVFALCRGVTVDFAAAAGGRGNKLQLTKSCADISGLPQGLLSVTCLPQTATWPRWPKWVGPMVMAFVPVKSGPTSDIPDGEVLRVDGAGENEFRAWINRIRSKERLPPLALPSQTLAAAAERLAAGSSVLHDRTALKAETQAIENAGLKFVGEDRVQGRDLADAAWQLYHSPRHRNLLLSADANQAALVLRKIEAGFFVLLVAGAESRPRMAKSRPAFPHRP